MLVLSLFILHGMLEMELAAVKDDEKRIQEQKQRQGQKEMKPTDENNR